MWILYGSESLLDPRRFTLSASSALQASFQLYDLIAITFRLLGAAAEAQPTMAGLFSGVW